MTRYCENDTFVLDTRTLRIKRVLEPKAALTRQVKFESINNASTTPAENVVVALVSDYDKRPHLIKYALDTNSLTIVQSKFP